MAFPFQLIIFLEIDSENRNNFLYLIHSMWCNTNLCSSFSILTKVSHMPIENMRFIKMNWMENISKEVPLRASNISRKHESELFWNVRYLKFVWLWTQHVSLFIFICPIKGKFGKTTLISKTHVQTLKSRNLSKDIHYRKAAISFCYSRIYGRWFRVGCL